MGATMRITWPLLSLSFLFLSICSNTDSQSATSALPVGGSTPRTIPTVTSKIVTVGGTNGAPSTGDAVKKSETTPDPKSTMPTTVVTMPAVTTTSKVSDKPTSARPQVTTITNNSPIITASPPPTTKSDAAAASSTAATTASVSTAATTASVSTAAATTRPLTVVSPVATPDGSVVTSNAAAVQTLKASTPETTSGTAAPGNMVTTEITKVSIGTLTSEQQSKTHTTIATMTSQDSSGGAAKTTMAVTGHGGPESRATEPAGNTGTTSTLPTLTKAGPSSPPLVTKAGTKPLQTTIATTTTITNTRTTGGTTASQLKTFLYSLNNGHKKEEEKDLVEVCRRLMVHLQDGNCTLTWQHHNGKIHFDCVEINGIVKTNLATQYYEEITKKPTDSKTLIAILASCGALLIMIVILAVCASHHRKPYNDNQQHLTEELHTVENGYHDNPTLEVMEVQPEMQEKKVALNGEFNDSWIVPIDNLLKGDVADEEDTHL